MVGAGLESGCIVVELALRLSRGGIPSVGGARARCSARRDLKHKANGLPPAPVGSCAQIAPKLSKTLAPPRARHICRAGGGWEMVEAASDFLS